MKVLIDTNVVLDVLQKREPHYAISAAFLKLCGPRVRGYISANQTTDIFYVLTRHGHDSAKAKAILKKLTDNMKVLDVTSADVDNALASDMPDYEDALLSMQAFRQKAEYIVTRNEKDYKLSRVPAISPQAFLDQFYSV
jgi:predicted nucleic acid-binding protein